MQFSYFILTNVKITKENTYPNPPNKEYKFPFGAEEAYSPHREHEFFSEKGYETGSVPFEELG